MTDSNPRSWMRRLKRLAFICGLMTVAAWLIAGALAASMLSGRPRPQFDEPVPAKMPYVEGLRLQTRDGESLGAWYVPPTPGKPVMILLHGIGDSRSGNAGMLASLPEKGLGGLAVSERAHGDSTGERCDVGWSGRNDVIAAVETVEQRAPGSPIVVFGVSMGAAASIFAAKELDHRVAGYILEAPYADLDKAVRIRVDSMVSPLLAVVAHNALRLWAPLFIHERLSAVSPARRIRDIPSDIPVLMLAGGADRLAPLEDIEAMVRDAGPHVKLEVFPNAGHVQLARWYPAEYGAALESLLARVDQRKTRPLQ